MPTDSKLPCEKRRQWLWKDIFCQYWFLKPGNTWICHGPPLYHLKWCWNGVELQFKQTSKDSKLKSLVFFFFFHLVKSCYGFFCLNFQAIEDGNLDEIEEELREEREEKKKTTRKRKKPAEPKSTEPPVKKKRGRPPVEKLKPNPPKVAAQLKKLLDIVLRYKDRYRAVNFDFYFFCFMYSIWNQNTYFYIYNENTWYMYFWNLLVKLIKNQNEFMESTIS